MKTTKYKIPKAIPKKLFFFMTLTLISLYSARAQERDSLSHYLQMAALNNPEVKANFSLYKASMEKIPQAGAYADPELEMGFYVKPMEQLSGKQVADFTLMQMFPWFGTRRAARNEATEMARMSYEQFRESRNLLYYEVKSQWYQLSNLHEQYKNTQANLALLGQLEQLALNRFAAATGKGQPAAPVSAPVSSSVSTPAPANGGMNGMSGMGGSAASGSGSATASGAGGPGMSSMQGMGGSSMSGGANGGMSDVLRIQLEKAELENQLETLLSSRRSAEARFNALLNREQNLSVTVPDSLVQQVFIVDDKTMLDSIASSNPMLTMLEAEANAYKAKAMMDKKMSYPMFGIGLQYSVMAKKANEMSGMDKMNGMDMFMPMVKISIPVFRKKYNAQQRESKFYRQASEQKYNNALNKLQSDYITLKQQLSDAARKVGLYVNQQQLTLTTYQLIVREFSAGMVSLTDVIQVERQLLDYRLKKSEAIAEYNTVIAGLEKLVSTSVNE